MSYQSSMQLASKLGLLSGPSVCTLIGGLHFSDRLYVVLGRAENLKRVEYEYLSSKAMKYLDANEGQASQKRPAKVF